MTDSKVRGLVRTFLAAAALCVAVGLAPTSAWAVAPDAYESDDIPTMAGTLGIDVPSAQDRTLHGYDMDWVRIEVQAGVPYTFEAISKPGIGEAPVRMMLWPAEVAQGLECYSLAWASTQQGSGTTTLMYTPTESTTLYLAVESFEFSDSCSYWLVAHTPQPWWDQYEYDDSSWFYGPFYGCGAAPLERALDTPEDVDWFTVMAFEPGEYAISTGFSAFSAPPDTQIEVWDESGTTLIASNDDGADGGPLSCVGQLTVSAYEPTTWRVRVSAAKGPSYGAYTFSAGLVPATVGRIWGTVTDADGAVVGNALVEVLNTDSVVQRTTRTAADGTFALEGWPFGEPFRVRADIEGAGLVPAMSPEIRYLADPAAGPSIVLGPEFPDSGFQLQVKRPWVSGQVSGVPGYAGLPDMTVTVYDLDGQTLGTGTTNGAYGVFFIELPAFTTGKCLVKVSDPSGVRRTTWYWNAPDAASSTTPDLPTFGGLGIYMPLSPPLTRYEQTDPNIAYEGKWTGYTGSGSSVSGAYCNDSAGVARVVFYGTRLDRVTLSAPGYGIASVSVDGGEPVDVDLYSPTFQSQRRVWSTDTLADGPHIVEIRYTGRKNPAATSARISTDIFAVDGNLEPASALTRYEQDDARIAYDGLWTTYTGSGSSVSGAYTKDPTAAVRVFLTGNRLDWETAVGPGYGIASVSIDGGEPVDVDLYSPTFQSKYRVWSTGWLHGGSHIVEIRYTGRKNPAATSARISTDLFAVSGTLAQAPVLTRYEQDDATIAYGGLWTTYSGSGSSVSGAYTKDPAGAVRVAFQGTRFDWMTATSSGYGIASVSVDGGEPVDVDLYSAVFLPQQRVWSTGMLADGSHVVEIRYTGRKNAAATSARIGADVFAVSGTLVP